MKTITLVLSVLALLGAIASAGLFVLIGNTKEALQRDLAASESRASRLSGELTEATEKGESLQRQLNALDADLGETKTKLTAAEARSVQMSRDLNQTRTQLAARQEAEQALTRELATTKRELVESKLAIANAVSPEQAETYRNTIARLEESVGNLQKQIDDMANTPVNTGGTALAMGAGGATSATLTANRAMNARVVTVGPKNAFVILNYGATSGAALSQELLVRRGPEPVARVQISDVRENYSVAQVLPNSLQGSLQKGDAAMVVN